MKFDQDKDGYTEVSLKVRGDGLWSVLRMLRHMQYHGDIGHSYGIVMDPDNSDYTIKTGWDGDGSDAIKELKVNGKELDRKQFDKEHLDMGKSREASVAKLWACGQWRREDDDGLSVWDFQGVFDSEERARSACKDDNWFIWPVFINAELPEEAIAPEGGYAPTRDREARIATKVAADCVLALDDDF